jgi:hypothetical protein
VARSEPTFNPRFALWRCWRGPAWMNTAWLLVPPMIELGYTTEAERIVRSLELAADRHGYGSTTTRSADAALPREGSGLPHCSSIFSQNAGSMAASRPAGPAS